LVSGGASGGAGNKAIENALIRLGQLRHHCTPGCNFAAVARKRNWAFPVDLREIAEDPESALLERPPRVPILKLGGPKPVGAQLEPAALQRFLRRGTRFWLELEALRQHLLELVAELRRQ